MPEARAFHAGEDAVGELTYETLAPILWAKSGNPPDSPPHSLAGHMLDTAAVALEVLDREPPATLDAYARALRLDPDAAARVLAAMAGAHDIGKATPSFQSKWAQGRDRAERAGFPFPRSPIPVHHGALTVRILERWLKKKGMRDNARWTVASALGAHHGFPAEGEHAQESEVPYAVGDGVWEQAQSLLLDALFRTVGAEPPVHLEDVPATAVVGLMALASLSDWIASNGQRFPYGRDSRDARYYFQEARGRSRAALDAIGWRPRGPLAGGQADFRAVFGFEPNDLQKTLSRLVQGASEPMLIVVEAPMGSGKTEAALHAHLELQRGAGHRGLYVALPTMAAGNGMFPRVRAFLDRLGGRPLDLQLQHGTAILNPDYRSIHPRNVGDGGEDDALAREWFTPRKRAMLSEYGVGTIDQALLSVLRVRHHFVRLFGLANRTVVLDEVHAYDMYTSSLIHALVQWLGRLGSSVIVMSATLPASRRAALIEAYGATAPAREAPYPRVTVARRSGPAQSIGVPGEHGREIQIRGIPRDPDAVADEAARLAREGGCVACIVNTVGRAQEIYQRLARQGEIIPHEGVPVGRRRGETAVYLFHARFPSDERRAREGLVLRLFGKDGYEKPCRPSATILVATQVAEQSLDLDFDAMISDLAPADLLMQRAGRLHRFGPGQLAAWGRARPGAHREARLLVAGLEQDFSRLDLTGWQEVYWRYVLLRSWWALRGIHRVTIPMDIAALVEQVYADELPSLPEGLRHEFEEARSEYERGMREQTMSAQCVAVTDEHGLLGTRTDVVSALRLDDDEEQAMHLHVPLTRYGEPSVDIVPLHRVGDALCLDPRGHRPVDLHQPPPDELAERIFGRSIRITGTWAFGAMSRLRPPKGWARHPLLRRLHPLEFNSGQAKIVGRPVRLDAETGLVYEWVRER
jgi:CRISPR-associated endonuclease/helicase Cas3